MLPHGIHAIRPLNTNTQSFSWSFWILMFLILSLIFGWPLSCGLGYLGESRSQTISPVQSNAPVSQVTDLSTILPPSTPTVLLLYSSSCPHCMHFLPTFADVAKSFSGKPVAFYRGHFSEVKTATPPELLELLLPIPGLPIVYVFPPSGPPAKLVGDMKADDFASKLNAIFAQ